MTHGDDRRAQRRARLDALCASYFPGDDGVDPRLERRGRGRKAAPRKTRQLCAQIARALDLALADVSDGPLLGVRVHAVRPGADPRHLEVVLVHPQPSAEALSALARARPWLRREAAAATHRKRVPELNLTVLGPDAEGGR